jgi:hypothetical protein
MKNQPEPQLPSSEQLEAFRIMHAALSYGESGITSQQKEEFCTLLLNLDPQLLEAADIELVRNNCPQLWQDYCEWQWGPAEERRELEEEELLAQGYLRGADGELYVPFP